MSNNSQKAVQSSFRCILFVPPLPPPLFSTSPQRQSKRAPSGGLRVSPKKAIRFRVSWRPYVLTIEYTMLLRAASRHKFSQVIRKLLSGSRQPYYVSVLAIIRNIVGSKYNLYPLNTACTMSKVANTESRCDWIPPLQIIRGTIYFYQSKIVYPPFRQTVDTFASCIGLIILSNIQNRTFVANKSGAASLLILDASCLRKV